MAQAWSYCTSGSLSGGELGWVPKEVLLIEKGMQLPTAALQAAGEIGTALEMSRKQMKVSCDIMQVFPWEAASISCLYQPREFLVGLICPFTATWLHTWDDHVPGPHLHPPNHCSIGTGFYMYLVEISGDSAGKRRLLYLLADDPPLRSHGGISELADYFPVFFLFCNYTGSFICEATEWCAGQT